MRCPAWLAASGDLLLFGNSAGFPQAKLRAAIPRILETDLAEGPEASREETIANFVDLTLSDASRDAVADVFTRFR